VHGVAFRARKPGTKAEGAWSGHVCYSAARKSSVSLHAGRTLAHYEILDTLGAGAMGEVYRARDKKLGREVAIKVLPEHFAADEERLKRFEREAKSLATLNHPNVAQIHGVDQVDDTCFLVLELVEGETLEERLRRGPLPLDEALDVCRQIAEGLEAAHEAGVIHRDLKPANIRITPEGKVKLLDFGLAKPVREGESGSKTDSVLSTEAGRVLGTPTYMAPEQARGKPIDRRVDVWAFGCVLYECLTGKRAFDGETLSDVLAAVLEKEPDWTRLPSATPLRVRELLADSFRKDPHARARDMGEIRRQIERARAEPAGTGTGKRPSFATAVSFTLLATIAGGIAGVLVAKRLQPEPRSAAPPPPTRFVVTLPEGAQRAGDQITALALSPDGRCLAVGSHTQNEGIYLRELGELELRFLPGTEGAGYMHFSPDGRWLAYHDRNLALLKRVALDGGKPQTIAPQEDATGIAWGPDGSIATAPRWGDGLFVCNASDGTSKALTRLDTQAGDRSHMSPCFLPGAKALLFQIWTGGAWDQARIALLDLETHEQRVVLQGGTTPRYLPFSRREGALLYERAESLWARRFDPVAGESRGDEALMVEGIQVDLAGGQATFAVSPAGTLAYQPKVEGYGQSQLWWVDREGREELATPEKMDHQTPSLSADGKRILFARGGAVFTIYSVDLDPPLEQRQPRRLTFEADSYDCLISPDGESMVYTTNSSGNYRTYVQGIVGGKPPQVIFDGLTTARAWSRDGRWIVLTYQPPASRIELWVVPADGSSPARPLVQVKGNAYDPQFSPDGEWLSYVSDAEGIGEISVVAFPAGDRRIQVTNGGGFSPRWSRDGSELFFRKNGEYFAMTVTRQPAPAFGTPRSMFQGDYASDSNNVGFYQAPDGRFLMNKPILPADRALRVVVVENFVQEVEEKLGSATAH